MTSAFRRLFVCLALMTGACSGLVPKAHAQRFLFTPVALSGSAFDPSGFNAPALNNAGQVAFNATLNDVDFTSGVFRYGGGTIIPIALRGSQFSRFGNVSINKAGQVGFEGSFEQILGEGIFRGAGGSVSTIAGTRNAGDFDFVNAGPQINANGRIAFIGALETNFTSGVFTGDGGPVTTLYDSTGVFSDFSGNPALNAAGQAAFLANLNNGVNGLFLGSGGAFTTVADVTGNIAFFFSDPSLNEQGDVAFTAATNDNPNDNSGGTGTGIFLYHNGTLTTIVQGGFDQFFGLGEPSLNNLGQVAFVAETNFDPQTFLLNEVLLTGPDLIGDRVIGTGDLLLGHSITGLSFSREGLNDSGQLAFTAFFDDGSAGIFLATPNAAAVPEPGNITLLACLSVTGSLFTVRRLRKRKR